MPQALNAPQILSQRKGPSRYIVYTCGPKGFPYYYFRALEYIHHITTWAFGFLTASKVAVENLEGFAGPFCEPCPAGRWGDGEGQENGLGLEVLSPKPLRAKSTP